MFSNIIALEVFFHTEIIRKIFAKGLENSGLVAIPFLLSLSSACLLSSSPGVKYTTGNTKHVSNFLLRFLNTIRQPEPQLHDFLLPAGQLFHGGIQKLPVYLILKAPVNYIALSAQNIRKQSSFRSQSTLSGSSMENLGFDPVVSP